MDAGIDAPQPDSQPVTELPMPARADDDALISAVQTRFAEAPSLKAAPIEVTAKDGVLLDGAVPTAVAKQRALSAAQRTDGVVQVIDRIRVERSRQK